MILDLEPQHHVVVQTDASVLLHDEHGRRLHASSVASRGMAVLQCGEEPERQVAVGLLETSDHLVHDFPARMFPWADT